MNKMKNKKLLKKSKSLKKESKNSNASQKPSLVPSENLKSKTLKNQELPTATISESNLKPTGATAGESFEKTIQESKSAIFESEQKAIKDPRGRKPLPRDANGNIIREHAPSNAGSVSHVGSGPAAPPSVVDLSGLLVEPLIIVSRIPARKHDIQELELEVDEAKALAVSIDKIFNAFVPDLEKMSPKTAALLTGGLTLSSILIYKMSIYSDVMHARRKTVYQNNVKDQFNQESESAAPNKNPFAKKDPFARQ